MSYYREVRPAWSIDRILCDSCGGALFPTDEDRYNHPERWIWAPWPTGQPCDNCGGT